MSKKMSNTKKMLIEVARVLFSKNGKKEVTMNDIAEASKKGRRTLYTYFNNKEEIYKAVIDKELEHLLDQLRIVSAEDTEPDIKLTNHIIAHLDAIKFIVTRNGSLRGDFFHDIYEVERTRRKVDLKEIELIKNILAEGIEKKVFKRMDPNLSSLILFHALKGLEVPYIRQNISAEFEKNKNSIVEFVFRGIKRSR
ncbi:MAG: TetR/AcrR family transcriptional regulator [Paludibacter sp.]|jgi:AcrR family transcriptional regulator|nr:TetR/AcrR family transcriptional regulator [Paludibacter sp.]MBP6662794.1 TetR/AcrR family transcriptional regulator [Paludibacter sp.]